MGMAMLAAVPLLSLILIRMLWSGSSLWFLTLGIILLGAAAVVFLARRPQEYAHGRRQGLAQESNRAPLVLAALGVIFLALLLLPNFAGGDAGPDRLPLQELQQPQAPGASSSSEVAGTSQPPSQPQATVQNPSAPASQTAGQTYVAQSGDTLWDIAQRFGTTVEAIVAANDLTDAADLDIGQELIIPPPEEETAGGVGLPEEPPAADGLSPADEAPVTGATQ